MALARAGGSGGRCGCRPQQRPGSSVSFETRGAARFARAGLWGRCEALWLRARSEARWGAPRRLRVHWDRAKCLRVDDGARKVLSVPVSLSGR